MIICSWNVNSINARLPRVIDFLKRTDPDVVCLQELKCTEEKYPWDAIKEAGYETVMRGQKTYNGVAILSKHDITDVSLGWDGEDGTEARFIGGTVNGVRLSSLYVPNGRAVGDPHYDYKLRWLDQVRDLTESQAQSSMPSFLLGDFNITPDDRDVHDPQAWKDEVLCSSKERTSLQNYFDLGWKDSWRALNGEETTFSWWDYRNLSFPKNKGLRIDLILANEAGLNCCHRTWIDRDERKGQKPSDHAPVLAELKI